MQPCHRPITTGVTKFYLEMSHSPKQKIFFFRDNASNDIFHLLNSLTAHCPLWLTQSLTLELDSIFADINKELKVTGWIINVTDSYIYAQSATECQWDKIIRAHNGIP